MKTQTRSQAGTGLRWHERLIVEPEKHLGELAGICFVLAAVFIASITWIFEANSGDHAPAWAYVVLAVCFFGAIFGAAGTLIFSGIVLGKHWNRYVRELRARAREERRP